MHVSRSTRWKIASAASAALAAVLARKSLEGGWRRATGRKPPRNPADRHGSWREALMWGGITGMGVGAARVVGRRGAAAAWRRLTGGKPPR